MSHVRERTLKSGEKVYLLVVEAGKNAEGKRIQRTKTLRNTTKRAAKAELSKFEQEVREGIYLEKDNITLKEFMGQWLETFVKPHCSPSTTSGYRQIYKRYICAHKQGIGHYPVQKLNMMLIQGFVNQLSVSSPCTERPLNPKTVKETYHILRSCLERAVDMEIIKKNPAERIVLPKRQKPKIEVFTIEEINRLLSVLKKEKSELELPVNLALSLGLRRGEVLGLKFSDVDFAAKTVNIHNNRIQCCDQKIVEKEPKTKNSLRTLSVPDTVLEMIRQEALRCKKRQLRLGKSYNAEGYVCYRRKTGKPWVPDDMSKRYSNLIDRLGITHVTFHGLRHCFASLCLKEGVEILEISRKLGHASASFTYDTYTHLMEDKSTYVANVVEEALYGGRANAV